MELRLPGLAGFAFTRRAITLAFKKKIFKIVLCSPHCSKIQETAKDNLEFPERAASTSQVAW